MKLLPPPGSTERRRLLWLGGVVVILGGVFWMLRTPAEQARAASPPVESGRAEAAGPLPVPESVRLASLEDVPVLADAVRNPFGYGVRPVAPAPPPRPIPALTPPAPFVPAAPPGPSGPPPIGLKLTGMTVPVEGGRTMITLRDPATNAVYLAYEGDIVDGRYRVVRVGVTSVVVSYVDGSGMRTIPLGG
jgi:hypothetical protein